MSRQRRFATPIATTSGFVDGTLHTRVQYAHHYRSAPRPRECDPNVARYFLRWEYAKYLTGGIVGTLISVTLGLALPTIIFGAFTAYVVKIGLESTRRSRFEE